MQIWRYKYKVLTAALPDEMSKKINGAAQKGWRLISAGPAGPGFTGYTAFMELDRISGR